MNVKNKLSFGFFGVIVLLAAITLVTTYLQNKQSKPIQHYPMVVFKDKAKLWQVVTYDEKPVTALNIQVKPAYKEVFRKVYINFRAQFVFSDGEPILILDEPIYWDRNGDVVTYGGKVVSEGLVFYVAQRAMKPNTAMTLFELKNEIKASYLRQMDLTRTPGKNEDKWQTVHKKFVVGQEK